jgi:L-ascorbate metabolism protein UlaG (beta-lactamase superfamily)
VSGVPGRRRRADGDARRRRGSAPAGGGNCATRALVALVALVAAACSAPQLPKELPFHPSDADLGVTRIVHGSFVLELRGTRLLVDPWFHSDLSLRQAEPLGLLPDALPTVAAVLLTQGRSDHFDPDALAELVRRDRVHRAIVPPGLVERVRDLGFTDVVPLDAWQKTTVDGVEVTATPTSRDPALLGYVVAAGSVQAYVAGDTKPFPELVDVATAFPKLQLAILPIGGVRVAGVLRDMTPEQAADAAALLKPAAIVPSDYGAASTWSPLVWRPSDPLARFRAALKDAHLDDRLVVLEPGESWHRYVKP